MNTIKAIHIPPYTYPVRRTSSGKVRLYGLSGWKGELPDFLIGLRASDGGELRMKDGTTIPLWDGENMTREAARALWLHMAPQDIDRGRAVARLDDACRWGDPDEAPYTWTPEDDARR